MLDPGDSLALRDDRDPEIEFNWLASIYIIYSAAGNVSYPSYKPPPGQKEVPWRFGAMEIIYCVCLNQYQTTFDKGDTLKTVIGMSKTTPVNTTQTTVLPAHDVNCTIEKDTALVWDGSPMSSMVCETLPDSPSTYFYLQDPEDPKDINNSFAISRDVLNSIAVGISEVNQYFYAYDGLNRADIQFEAASRPFFDALYGETGDGVDINLMNRYAVNYFNNQAITFTNALVGGDSSPLIQNGTAWSDQVFISISWPWVTLLAFQMVFSYLFNFMAITIWHTAGFRIPVLKSSELATLLALTAGVQEALGPLGSDLEAVETCAESILVRLVGENNRIVLV